MLLDFETSLFMPQVFALNFKVWLRANYFEQLFTWWFKYDQIQLDDFELSTAAENVTMCLQK